MAKYKGKTTDDKKDIKDTPDKSTKDGKMDKKVEDIAPSKSGVYTLRNAYLYVKKDTEITDYSDFYEFSADRVSMKVPVRAECIAEEPLFPQRVVHYGRTWSWDGTITTPIDPLVGIAWTAATFKGFTYDPSANWAGANWSLSHGGRIYFALINQIRASDAFTNAELLKIVKALLGYDEIIQAVMMFLTHYHTKDDGRLNILMDSILSSSGGSEMFRTRADLLSQVILNMQDNFFPYPIADFWKKRETSAYAMQTPWWKYEILSPLDDLEVTGLARLFDAWTTTNNWMHPQTYLENEGLWNRFCTDLVPLLWNKQKWDRYVGISPVQYLASIGWSAIQYDPVMFDWLRQKFWLHPFDETLGIGQDQLPKKDVDPATGSPSVHTMEKYYWGDDGKGVVFYIYQDAYIEDSYPDSHISSPWLDPTRFVGILANYAADDDAGEPRECQMLRANIQWDKTTVDLRYDTFYGLFPKYLEYVGLELVEPDPDIDLNGTIYSDEGAEPTWYKKILALQSFRHPFKMPAKHWYFDSRKLYALYSMWLGVNRDDVELYKRQRAHARTSDFQESGDKGVHQK